MAILFCYDKIDAQILVLHKNMAAISSTMKKFFHDYTFLMRKPAIDSLNDKKVTRQIC